MILDLFLFLLVLFSDWITIFLSLTQYSLMQCWLISIFLFVVNNLLITAILNYYILTYAFDLFGTWVIIFYRTLPFLTYLVISWLGWRNVNLPGTNLPQLPKFTDFGDSGLAVLLLISFWISISVDLSNIIIICSFLTYDIQEYIQRYNKLI